jgi:hypothetical protein
MPKESMANNNFYHPITLCWQWGSCCCLHSWLLLSAASFFSGLIGAAIVIVAYVVKAAKRLWRGIARRQLLSRIFVE